MPDDRPAILERPDLSWKEKTAYIAYRLNLADEGIEAPVSHIFDKGVYIREMNIPAGVMIVGRPHALGHRCELVSGSVLHVTEHGRAIVDAPFDMHTAPGDQIVIYTLSPVVARTYHPNPDEERDVAKLEDHWFLPAEPILQLGSVVHARLAA